MILGRAVPVRPECPSGKDNDGEPVMEISIEKHGGYGIIFAFVEFLEK